MLHNTRNINFKWISYLKSIFNNTGLSYIWIQQYSVDLKQLKVTAKQKLTDECIQNWYNQIENSSREVFYDFFKEEFGLENYLHKLLPSERVMIPKLRCSNLKIPIELGRWYNVQKEERICHLCQTNVGNECHYILEYQS